MAIVTKSPAKPMDDQQLMADLWSEHISDNPYNFVMYAFPWGRVNTPLERFKGPRSWQKDELLAIAQHIQDNRRRMARNESPTVYKSAVASGRGPGKSTLVAWLNLWMMSCHIGSTSINTANNETQLKTRTWAELGKWHTLSINAHWFDKQAMSLKPHPWFEEALKKQLKVDTGYYYSAAQLWSEETPDAFAGVHNHNGVMVIFDEASGIPQCIWTVTEGFFTEPVLHRYHFAFSNPRRNTGAFFECFHRFRKWWRRRNIDSRTVEGTDLEVLNNIVEQYGEDSDEARIEVKGLFPKQGDKQFISRDIVEDAINRAIQKDPWAPLIMGVDPARYGDDDTVIRFRQGRDARSIPPLILKQRDNMEVANICADLIVKFNPDAVCIDAGNGTGIIDRLRELKFKVHEVWFGEKSPKEEFANMRTYLWDRMREWLRGGCIDDSAELSDDLTAPEYKFQGTSDKQRLETKEELKARGFSSPDNADALACTFAVNVARRDLKTSRHRQNNKVASGMDYSIFG